MYFRKKSYQFGKYTWSEITAMVADGYIPVANATELNALRTTAAQTMGVGSIWEDTYTTGLNKKYVQINHIDLSGFANWVRLDFTGTYDGNNLKISNCTQSGNGIYSGLFGNCTATLLNCIFDNFDIRGTNTDNRLGCISNLIGTATNCIVLGGYFYSTTARNGVGSFGNIAGNVLNCHAIGVTVEGGTSGTFHYVGGFSGVIRPGSVVENCSVTGSVTSTHSTTVLGVGGFVGYLGTSSDSDIKNCYANVTVNGANDVGGFCGWNRSVNKFTNCYSSGAVTGTTRVGGFCGTNAGTITNCYYDKDISGKTDSTKGLPRTTLQMINGTASSFINPDGTVDGTFNPANAMYTGWSNTIWNFRTNLKYPKIRKT